MALRRVSFYVESEIDDIVTTIVADSNLSASSAYREIIEFCIVNKKLPKKFITEFNKISSVITQKRNGRFAKGRIRELYFKSNFSRHLYRLCAVDYFSDGDVDMPKVKELIDCFEDIYYSFDNKVKKLLYKDFKFVISLRKKARLHTYLSNLTKLSSVDKKLISGVSNNGNKN